MSAIPRKVREIVLARAAGRCERCGDYVAMLELHHRKFRSRGGYHVVENLVALCGAPGGMLGGNAQGCHGWAHTIRSEDSAGFSLHSWETPGDAPVTLFARGPVHLLHFAPWIVEAVA